MKPFVVIAGPTAVGKTELGIALAERIGGEIISADSRQIYVDMDIGTAKPSTEQRAHVRHHFIDELRINEPFSAGRFGVEAGARMREILDRGRVPLIVGGSSLYLHSLKHGLADVPDVPTEVREAVQSELEARGRDALYRELRDVDPESAARLDPTKTQRLIRALEVYRSTGRPLSSYHGEQAAPSYAFRTFVLNRDRSELYRQINRRVDTMLSNGLLDEVRTLLDRGYDPSLNPLRTIGYKEPIRHLHGEFPYDEMVRLVKRNSRRYAKRQLTWFRRDVDNDWLDASKPRDQLVEAVLAAV